MSSCVLGIVLYIFWLQRTAADEIIFGQSAALNVPGLEMYDRYNAGLHAAFKEVNSNGGVYGRTIKLITKNDNLQSVIRRLKTLKLC